MKNFILFFFLLICFVVADENMFWMDLEKVYTTNVDLSDTTCKPAISKIRKLFYDGKLWDMMIPDAKEYAKPQDAVSLAFQRKYAGDVLILTEKEDVKHMLGGLDSYFRPKAALGEIMNYDICSWLGDIASALNASHKQNIPLEKAFAAYASIQDLKANIAAFRIAKLALPYIQETYKFPVVEICRNHYYSWHNLVERQKFLQEYFASMGLAMAQNSQGVWEFTATSRQNFLKKYTGQVKTTATAFYFAGSRFPFSDSECQTTLNLFLAEMQKFYTK